MWIIVGEPLSTIISRRTGQYSDSESPPSGGGFWSDVQRHITAYHLACFQTSLLETASAVEGDAMWHGFYKICVRVCRSLPRKPNQRTAGRERRYQKRGQRKSEKGRMVWLLRTWIQSAKNLNSEEIRNLICQQTRSWVSRLEREGAGISRPVTNRFDRNSQTRMSPDSKRQRKQLWQSWARNSPI